MFRGAMRKNVQHLEISKDQIIGDDLAMTLPPIGLGAHDGTDLLRSSQRERVQRREKWSCLRMIGITPEERIAPT